MDQVGWRIQSTRSKVEASLARGTDDMYVRTYDMLYVVAGCFAFYTIALPRWDRYPYAGAHAQGRKLLHSRYVAVYNKSEDYGRAHQARKDGIDTSTRCPSPSCNFFF